MKRHRLILSAGAAVLVTAAACGNSTPTSPTATTATASVVTVAAPTTCSAWAGTQRAVSNRYFAAWFPSGWSSSSPRRVLVDLHGTTGGHGGLAKNADAWGSMFAYFEGLRWRSLLPDACTLAARLRRRRGRIRRARLDI